MCQHTRLHPVDCISYYCNQAGGGPYFSSDHQIQRGYSIFSNIRRFAVPLMRRAGKYLGKKLLSTGRNVIDDLVQGKSLKESSRDRILESGRAIKKDIIRKLQTGSGKNKRKRKVKRNQNKRRKVSGSDVFSSL